jgi:hypothetical protein
VADNEVTTKDFFHKIVYPMIDCPRAKAIINAAIFRAGTDVMISEIFSSENGGKIGNVN